MSNPFLINNAEASIDVHRMQIVVPYDDYLGLLAEVKRLRTAAAQQPLPDRLRDAAAAIHAARTVGVAGEKLDGLADAEHHLQRLANRWQDRLDKTEFEAARDAAAEHSRRTT